VLLFCRRYGCPDLFITLWSEVIEALASFPGQHAVDRPDIVDRVFHMKSNLFMDDIVKGMFFGPVLAGDIVILFILAYYHS